MPSTDQPKPDPTWEEVKRLHDRLPPDEETEALEAAGAYMWAMTPGERLARNSEASRVTERLNALAKQYGLRAAAWYICGPAEPDAPDVSKLGV